jgi:CRP-like cAMP-binding protein
MSKTDKHQSPCVSFLREQKSDCVHCALRSSALFAGVRPANLDARLSAIHNGLVRAETVIYREGDAADWVFTIRSGVVKLVARQGTARSRILRVLGRGAAIGLEALDGAPYEHTAVALWDLNLCRLPLPTLRDLGAVDAGLLVGMVAKWHEHARWADRCIHLACAGRTESRIPSLIRLLADISGDPPEAIRLPRTADMASIVGCTPEVISRRMAELKRSGLLTRMAPWTYRCDPSLLTGAAAPDATAG